MAESRMTEPYYWLEGSTPMVYFGYRGEYSGPYSQHINAGFHQTVSPTVTARPSDLRLQLSLRGYSRVLCLSTFFVEVVKPRNFHFPGYPFCVYCRGISV